MKLFTDLKDIENVGEILVRCYVQENLLTESQASLMVSKSNLLTESFVGAVPEYDYKRGKYKIRLDHLIAVYIEPDSYKTAISMMAELGVPFSEFAKLANPEQSAKNAFTDTIFPWAIKHDEGRKWISPAWKDRNKYSKSAVKSIHPSKVGYEHGLAAIPSDGSDFQISDVWDEEEMVDRGRRNRATRSDRVIDTFNKSEIALGEFYSNISRIKTSTWGRIWQREKASVASDRTTFGRRWKKIFVLGYQIDKAVLYEIWYGTMDGMFTVHDKSGNQISRKFPTVSEATKALTNAIVQSSEHDARIFQHGGSNANKIASSIVKSLNSTTDSMVDDLMKVEDRELKKRLKIERDAETKRKATEDHWARVRQDVKRKASATIVAPAKALVVGGAKWTWDVSKYVVANGVLRDKDVYKLASMAQQGIISPKLANYIFDLVKASGKLGNEAVAKIAREFSIQEAKVSAWKRDVEAGRMTIDEFATKVQLESEKAERMQFSTDEQNARSTQYANQFNTRPTTDGNDNNKPEETVRPTTVKKHLGYSGMTPAEAEEDIRNSGIPPYATTVGKDRGKIRAYIAMLLNEKKYANMRGNRGIKDEIRLIALDVYGKTEMEGTVASMVKSMKKDGVVLRESFDTDWAEDDVFDISDELDSRRQSTVNTLRRNSTKVAMTISDLKDAINSDLVTLYSETRINETKWAGKIGRLLNSGRKIPIVLPTDTPSIAQRVRMFFQGTRYRADFVTGVSLADKINVEVWYVTEPNPNAKIFDAKGVMDAEYHGRATISSFYVFDVTAGTLVRRYLPYHKNALQVAMAKLSAL